MSSVKEVIYEKQFSPELAGETIAWIGKRENKDFVHVDIAIADIARDGAEYGCFTLAVQDSTVQYHESKGFESALGLHAAISKKPMPAGIRDHELYLFNSRTHQKRALNRGESSIDLVSYPDMYQGTLAENGEWISGRELVLSGLKKALSLEDERDYYPHAYYLLNKASEGAPNLADPEMIDATKKEKQSAEDIKTTLKDSLISNEQMYKNLTVFGDIPANKIVREYDSQRKEMRRLQVKIQELTRDGYILDHIPDIGFRPSGRSWPYVDANEADPKKAYGYTKQVLKSKNPWPVFEEIKRENQELKLRIEYAIDVVHMLGWLSIAEQELASQTIKL